MPRRNASSVQWSGMSLDSGIVTSQFNISSAVAEAVRPGAEDDGSAAEPETCWHLVYASNAVYLYAFPLLLMLGILFNSINFVLLRSSIGLRLYSFTVFVCTVSVTDSLALVAQAPRRWLGLLYRALYWPSLLQPTTVYDTTDAACKALSYAAELTQFVSLWTVVLLAWERTIVAQNPYRQSRFRQTRTACHAVAFVVISGFVLKSHVIVSWQTTTHPLVAVLTSGNATKSSLMALMTSTKRPTRDLPNRRCAPHSQEDWTKRKEECGEENRKNMAKTEHRSEQNEREQEYRKLQIDVTSQTRKYNLRRPPFTSGETDQIDTSAVNTRLSSAYDPHNHGSDLTVETNNRFKSTALNQPNDTLPADYRDFLSNDDREAALTEVHPVVSNTTVDPRDTGASRTTAVEAQNENYTSCSSRRLIINKETSEKDTTRDQWTANGTVQNGTEFRTDVESFQWDLPQQNNATPFFIKDDNTPQGFRDSPPVPTGHEILTDASRNGSKPDMESQTSLAIPVAAENASIPTAPLKNLSGYSATSSDVRSLNTGAKDSTSRQKLIPNWTAQLLIRSRLKKRDITAEHETQPRAKRCSRLANVQCQFIPIANATQTTTAIWMVSLVVEALTKIVPAVVLSALLVTSLSGLHSWNINQTRLSTDLTCRLLMERHVTIMAVVIITSQVVLCLPMSVVWLLDLYFRLTVTGLSTCEEAQMAAAGVFTELVFIVNFAVKFLLCFISGRRMISI